MFSLQHSRLLAAWRSCAGRCNYFGFYVVAEADMNRLSEANQCHQVTLRLDKVLARCVSVSKTKFCTPGFFYEYFFADFYSFFLQVCRGQVVLVSESPEQVG